MANKRPSYLKRQKEQKRTARAAEKRETRKQRKESKLEHNDSLPETGEVVGEADEVMPETPGHAV
jgi:hypothetical protein